MKPTQRDSYESLWNALHEIDSAAVFLPTFEVTHDGGIEAVTKNIVDAIKKAVVALERGGAGGGELVAYMCPTSRAMADGSMEDGPDYLEWADEASDYEKRVGTPLYTHPSPTDLRAECLRGLEDAKKACESWANQHSSVSGGCTHVDCDFMAAALDCAEAIEALKGKQ